MFSDLLSVPAVVRSPAEHELVSHHSQREVVGRESVVLVADDLGCHVPWSPTRILMVVISHDPRHSQIRYAQVPLRVQHEVLGFEIAVDDLALVQILQPDYDVRNEKFSLRLAELAFAADVVSQIPAVQVVHHQVQVFPVLERAFHVDEEGVLQICQQGPLVHDRVDRFLIYDFGLLHFLHCIDFAGPFASHLPHFAKPALPNRIHHFKRILPNQIVLILSVPVLSSHVDFLRSAQSGTVRTRILIDEQFWDLLPPRGEWIAFATDLGRLAYTSGLCVSQFERKVIN